MPVTVSAVTENKVVRLTKAKLKAGSGSVPFVIPKSLAGATFTFEVTTLVKDVTLGCRTPNVVNQISVWVTCDTRTYEVAPTT